MAPGAAYAGKYLDAAYGSSHSSVFPANHWVSLFAGTPGAGGVELVGGGYAPVGAVANNSANWPNAIGNVKTNGATFTFPTATADWVEATHWATKDGAGGAIVDQGLLGEPVVVRAGQTFYLAPGDLVMEAQ